MDVRSFKSLLCALAGFMAFSAISGDEPPLNWPIPALPKGESSTTFAVPRNDWMVKFDRNYKIAKEGKVDLLFQGDSITEGWRGAGKDVWKERYGKFNAATFGISSDRVENVLWRSRNGELDGISPKLIVLMIGTNNDIRNTKSVADGIKAIVDEMRKRCPDSQILLLGVFPRGEKASDWSRAKIAELNKTISGFASEKITYLDIGKAFLDENGSIKTEIMRDFLHPTAAGYKIWADQIQSEIDKYMNPAK